MSKRSVSRSRAISPVISAIIISAVVLACGGAVWAFSQGAMTITAEDYAEDVIEMTEVISERFIIEMVWYDSVSVKAEPVGIGDGITTEFNFVYIPVFAGIETIYFDDDSQTDDLYDYTFDEANVAITFIDPLGEVPPLPGVVITADYKYIIEPLDVWIFNYGSVDIEVKVQVKDETHPVAEDEWKEIPSKAMEQFTFIDLGVILKEELNIKAYTKRGNNAYYRYVLP